MYGIPQLFAQGSYTRYTYITYCFVGQPCSGAALTSDYGGSYVPPSYTGSGTIGTSLFRGTLNAGFTANYWSGRAPIDAPSGSSTTAPYVPPASWPKSIIVSTYVSYKVMSHFDLGASGENLTNRYYLDPLSIAFLPSPGRIVRLNATINF
jgi:hemoglobin/transferrin/lactoferrin receptor protein